MNDYKVRTLPLLVLAALTACQSPLPQNEIWHGSASIADGRQIPFVLHLNAGTSPPSADFLISDERTPVPEVILDGDSVHLIIAEYDAAFRLRWDGSHLRGRYERYRSDTTGFPVTARPASPETPRSASTPEDPLAGTFTVLYARRNGVDTSSSAVFWGRGDSVFGTVVAPSGDDGLFAGVQRGDSVFLSRFTGWQSIYLEMVRDGSEWVVQRYIRENSPYTFRIRPRVDLAPEPVGSETRLRSGIRQFTFEGVTPEGDTVRSTDVRFKGKPIIVDIMGTWCHNCLDSAPILQKIFDRHQTDGLEVVSLAFELRDDLRSGLRNISIFRDRHDLTYTLLYCGDISNENVERRIASQLEHFGAYPTALFIDRSGTVIDIHKGFKGPGAGPAYQEEIALISRLAERLARGPSQ